MVEPSIFRQMAHYASLTSEDVVLDIGAGFGFLTAYLADKCAAVLAVEADTQLATFLIEQLAPLENVKVIPGDIFKVTTPQFSKIVSIPPYHVSSRLLRWVLGQHFECAVLVLQKEFAGRLVAMPGSKEYGWLTVLTHYRAEVELRDVVSRRLFYPQPKVDSTIVCLRLRRSPPFRLSDEKLFEQLLRSLFTQRNRKVKNAATSFLRGVLHADSAHATETAGILPFRDKRVRDLQPEDFGVLTNAVNG